MNVKWDYWEGGWKTLVQLLLASKGSNPIQCPWTSSPIKCLWTKVPINHHITLVLHLFGPSKFLTNVWTATAPTKNTKKPSIWRIVCEQGLHIQFPPDPQPAFCSQCLRFFLIRLKKEEDKRGRSSRLLVWQIKCTVETMVFVDPNPCFYWMNPSPNLDVAKVIRIISVEQRIFYPSSVDPEKAI